MGRLVELDLDGLVTTAIELLADPRIAVERAVDEAIAADGAAGGRPWARYVAGEDRVAGLFVGKVMKATGGKAGGKAVTALLQQKRPAPPCDRFRRGSTRPIVSRVPRSTSPRMSGAGIRRTTFYVPLGRGKLAIAAVVALGIIGATVFLVPSWESPKPVSAPAGSPAASAPAPAAGAPAGRGGGGGGGGGGEGGGASSSGASGDHNGLQPATKAVSATVVAGVHAVAPGTVDRVLVAGSDPSWAVAHVTPSSGNHGLFILVHYAGGWYEVESGYPQMPCDEAIPTGVQADLGLLMASCA